MNDNRNSKPASAQTPVQNDVLSQARRKPGRLQTEPAALLSPAALLALGLAGVATAAQRAADPGAVAAEPAEALPAPAQQPADAVVRTEAEAIVAGDGQADVAAAGDAADTAAAAVAEPVQEGSADAALGTQEAEAEAAPEAQTDAVLPEAEVQGLPAADAADAAPAAGLDAPVMVAQAATGAAGAAETGAAAGSGAAGSGAGAAGAGAGAGAAGAGAAGAAAAGITATTAGIVAGVLGVVAVADVSADDAAPDTTPPAAPTLALAADTGSSATDGVTRNGQVNVAGLEQGASWQFSTNGGTTWTAGTGTSFTLDAGSYAAGAVQVRQTDAAGNNSTAASLPAALVVDGTGPAAATLALAADTGSSAADGITSNGSIAVTGLEADATWEFSTNGGTTWAAGEGSSFALAAGTYAAGTVQVRQTDVAGNLGTVASLGAAVTVDQSAAAPTLALASDTGSSASDGITRTGTVQVSGLETGAGWEFSTNGGTTWSAGTGTTFTLAAGSYAAGAVQVRQTDAAGNLSPAGSGVAWTVDATAPAALSAALAADTGSSASDGITRNGVVNVSGLEAGATWQFSTNGGTTWTAGTGTSFTLSAGSYAANAVQVRQIDVAGNTGAAGSIAAAMTVDTAAAAPTLALATDSGSSGTDGVTNVGTVLVSGLETGSTWQFSTNGGTSFANGTGNSFTLPAGTYAANGVQVRQTDLAGNTSAVGGNAASLTVDASAAAPVLALASDTGSSSSDGITGTGTINVTGLEAGATWRFSTDGGTTFTAGTGTSFSLPAGSYAAGVVRVVQTDLAGNASAAGSNAAALTVDTTAPAAPAAALAVDTGSSDSDGITGVGTVNVTGLEAGATWAFSTDGGASFSAGTGTSFTLAAGSYAAGAVQVRQTDVAGNTSVVGQNAGALTVDATAAAPTLALASDTGSSASDGVSNAGTVNVSGLEPGASWQFSTDGGSTFADGTGSSFTLAPGVYAAGDLQVVQTDVAGNDSPLGSNAAAVTIDTAAPAAPVVALGADTGSSNSDGITRDGTVNVSGLEAGASWQFSINGGTSFAAGTGSSFALPAGNYSAGQVQVRQVDQAGNQGPSASLATGVQVDTAMPTVQIESPSGGPDGTGKIIFNIVFGEAVSGFDAGDVAVANGTKGAFTPVDATHFQLEVTPASSTTPVNLTLDVAAGAAADTAGNDSAAAAQFLQSVLFGTAGNDTLTVGSAMDYVFLGAGGNDVVALNSAANSTAAATDVVNGLSAGDMIDLSGMLGTAGYTGLESGFIALKNQVLTQDATANTTEVSFDVAFAASTIGGSKVSGAVIDLGYEYAAAVDGFAVSPKFGTRDVWQLIQPNLSPSDGGSGSQINGQIALVANPNATNPIITTGNAGTGAVLNVTLVVDGLVDSFPVSLELQSGTGSTTITTADNVSHAVEQWLLDADGVLEVVQDNGALGALGDNQLRFVVSYDAQADVTHLQLLFDVDSAFGAGKTTASEVVAMDFEGDVQNLIPTALHYVGP